MSEHEQKSGKEKINTSGVWRNALVIAVVGIPGAVLWFNGAMHLLSIPNDLAVYGGYVVLVGLLAAIVAGGVGVYRWLHAAGLLAVICCLCGCYRMVEPGHVGLLVKQTGTDRGVQDYPIQAGRVFYNPWNESVLEWPTNVQRCIWSKDSKEGHPVNEEIAFQSKEGLHFTADVNAAYQMAREKVPHFYIQFRTEDIDGFTHGFFRDAVRNAFNISTNYTAEDINGFGQSELILKVQELVKAKMEPYGVEVIQIGFAAPPRPPDQVQTAIHNKIAAIQKAEQTENEKRAAVAEGEKIKALAEAMADANRITNASITPQLIEWEKLEKWDGHNPQVISGSASTLVTVK